MDEDYGIIGYPHIESLGDNPALVEYVVHVGLKLVGERTYFSASETEKLLRQGFVRRVASFQFDKKEKVYLMTWKG